MVFWHLFANQCQILGGGRNHIPAPLQIMGMGGGGGSGSYAPVNGCKCKKVPNVLLYCEEHFRECQLLYRIIINRSVLCLCSLKMLRWTKITIASFIYNSISIWNHHWDTKKLIYQTMLLNMTLLMCPALLLGIIQYCCAPYGRWGSECTQIAF